ncbi:hypothetical protein KZ463_04555 [Glaesserella parasuis]|uniref:hypothetical protein n=1 Tax=Glaesserella parasuis TaxID=738 RepID=UPI0003ABFA82|nr:hypothetical protein [Glaesserella parasuis]EQA13983.1 putative lipoprotein [Glaesserella parasuis SW140]MCT8552950.1 hypothetical protein [Glaesserella parasuis]MCT8756518.1 hypothetical protein [Glaesserella parasuis]MDG6374324.1 hypothetical protein [Glaesserella parasuis]MDG6795546.1 hypothetical protein [Glaesserella parasuis]
MKKILFPLIYCLGVTACATKGVLFEMDNQGDVLMKQMVAGMQSKEQLIAMGMTEQMAENSIKASCEGVAKATTISSFKSFQSSSPNRIKDHITISTDDLVYRATQCMQALGISTNSSEIQKLKQNAELQQKRLDTFKVR